MEFDKSKVLTCVTADQAKVGQMGWFSNHLSTLERYVAGGYSNPDKLIKIRLNTTYTFSDGHAYYSLFYPAPEPTYDERQAIWVRDNNVKIGTRVRITREFSSEDLSHDCLWNDDMDKTIGLEGTVTVIGGKSIAVRFSGGFWWYPYFSLEVIKEPTYRQYNNNELNDLVGEVLTNKQSGRRKLVTGKPTASEGVNIDGSYINAKDLLFSFYRNRDEPCGVKEEA